MKKFIVTIIVYLITGLLVSCAEPGANSQYRSINDSLLPPELKGLKVYDVFVDQASSITVAVLNNNVNSINYRSGKTTKTVLMLDNSNENNKIIEVEKILMENDSMIICTKNKSKGE